MPTPSLTDDQLREAAKAFHDAKQAGSKAPVTDAAAALGLHRNTYDSRLRSARLAGFVEDGTPAPLAAVGYELTDREMTPEEAWATDCFAEKAGQMMARQWRTINRPAGPGVIFHQTDVHVDDDGVPLRLVEEDIRAAKDLDAIMCHGGDLLNNWPMAGRLARQWAEQKCSRPMALLRAEHYLNIFEPDVLTWGNHEEMNPYLTDLLDRLLPRSCITDHWSCNFIVKPKGGRKVRCILSHKFAKGSSWFHRMHGHLREMLEGQEADLLMDGHLHCSGVMEHDLPERGLAAVGVASGGYKLTDNYARRISRGGNGLKLRGRAHWVVYDPDGEEDESLCVAFKSARQAEAYLNGLQNLRAA